MSYVTNVVACVDYLSDEDARWLTDEWPPGPLQPTDPIEQRQLLRDVFGGGKVMEGRVYGGAFNHWGYWDDWPKLAKRDWSFVSQFVVVLWSETGNPWVFIKGRRNDYGLSYDGDDYTLDIKGAEIRFDVAD